MTVSTLVIGTPRIEAKPPRRIPCVEPYIQDANVLRDPGFEKHSTVPTGPFSEAYPGEIGAGVPPWPLWWADGTTSAMNLANLTGWAAFSNQSTNPAAVNRWSLSTANPRTGGYHARADAVSAKGALGELIPVGLSLCVAPGVFTARVEPGDLIEWAAYVDASSTTNTPQVDMYVELWDETLTTKTLEDGNYNQALTTSYAEYSYTVVAPAASHYLMCFLFPHHSGSSLFNSDVIIDVDDATLGIT